MKAGGGGGSAIVNPATLDTARRNSVCTQCHLGGEVRIERAGSGEFIPGQNFADHAVVFVRAGNAGAKVTSHVENLAESACKRASGDKLWCGSCHDSHSLPTVAGKASLYRTKCLACHAVSDCGAEKTARAARQDDCTACHMPRNPVSDAEHVVQTDHSIPRRPTERKTFSPRLNAPLVPFGQKTAGTRELGLAYAMMAIRENNPRYQQQAFDLLSETNRKQPEDSQTLSYLADIFKKRSDDAHAIGLYERLLRIDPSDLTAPVALGGYRMEAGNYEDAIRLWKDALHKNPALLLVRANLAVALTKVGRSSEAREVLNKALEFNPNFEAGRKLLESIRP